MATAELTKLLGNIKMHLPQTPLRQGSKVAGLEGATGLRRGSAFDRNTSPLSCAWVVDYEVSLSARKKKAEQGKHTHSGSTKRYDERVAPFEW